MKGRLDLLLDSQRRVSYAKLWLMPDANMAPLEAPLLHHTQVRKELGGR